MALANHINAAFFQFLQFCSMWLNFCHRKFNLWLQVTSDSAVVNLQYITLNLLQILQHLYLTQK